MQPTHARAFAPIVHPCSWTALSLGGSLVVGLAFLLLVRRSARALVFTAIALQVMSVPAGLDAGHGFSWRGRGGHAVAADLCGRAFMQDRDALGVRVESAG